MRRASWRSVPRMCSPPMPATTRPSAFICSRCFDFADQGVPFLLRHFQPGGIFLLELGPGHGLGIAAEDDVGAAAGHVRGDGHGAQPAGLGDDLGLALVVLGVEDLVGDAPLLQQAGDQLAPLDRDRAHQDRPPAALDLLDLALGDGFAVLAAAGLELDGLVGFVDDLAQVLLALFVHQHVPLVHPLDFVGDGGELLALACGRSRRDCSCRRSGLLVGTAITSSL